MSSDAVRRAGDARRAASTAGAPAPIGQPSVSRPQVPQRSFNRRGSRANASSWPKIRQRSRKRTARRAARPSARSAPRYEPWAACASPAGPAMGGVMAATSRASGRGSGSGRRASSRRCPYQPRARRRTVADEAAVIVRHGRDGVCSLADRKRQALREHAAACANLNSTREQPASQWHARIAGASYLTRRRRGREAPCSSRVLRRTC